MTNKPKHGGARQGSGAPLKYGEELKAVTFRIPKSQVNNFKSLAKEFLNKCKIK